MPLTPCWPAFVPSPTLSPQINLKTKSFYAFFRRQISSTAIVILVRDGLNAAWRGCLGAHEVNKAKTPCQEQVQQSCRRSRSR